LQENELDLSTVFNLGMGEITVIVLLALIFLGPKKLPELASGLGKLIREIRKTTQDVKNEIQLDEAIRKPLEELREAVTLHPDELKRRDRIRRDIAIAEREAAAAAKLLAEALPSESGEAGDTAGGAAPEAAAEDTLRTIPSSDAPSSPAAPGGAGEAGPSLGAAGLPPVISAAPAAAPIGTIPRQPLIPRDSSALPSTLQRPLKAAAVSPPAVDSAADRSNTTQALSEADLAAIAVGPRPPPPPAAARTGRTLPPPSPALPGATPARSSFGKSGPIAGAAKPATETKSGPVATTAAAATPDEKKPEGPTSS
jgi:sec-independent protein translocase protein TatB